MRLAVPDLLEEYLGSMNIKRPRPKQPIPKHAKRVFHGIMFDVYQWKQKLFDGTFATFESIKREDTVNIIPVTIDGKIIATHQKQPRQEEFIGLPGGRMDTDVYPLSCAKRELLEETGFEAQEFVLWDAIQPFTMMDWTIYTFVAKGCVKNTEINPDPGEKISVQFLSFEEFVDLMTHTSFRDLEVAMKILRVKEKPRELAEIKKLLFG